MYQWRKFESFEEKSSGKSSIPNEVEGKIECCSSGRGKIVVGCDDGTVNFLDRGLRFIQGFPAHASSVLFLQQLKVVIVPIWKTADEKTGVLNAVSSVEKILKTTGFRVKVDDSEQRTPGWKFNFWEMKR